MWPRLKSLLKDILFAFWILVFTGAGLIISATAYYLTHLRG